ncbi:UMP kinase [Haloglomus irregulare]|jgi:uridylate kinase|uniref:Uridylate kinase n=1 Tax=Haloglomus irregulare TaxID=2234134 RepID=A0A554NCZ8_9EURY|nr:UMP kinase [Haloglomus irregulare]TSD15238.1 UMP kinase [Haloglomus irregulare]
MKLVVSVGGSVLAPDLEPGRVAAYGDVLGTLAADHEVAAVVGGGRVAREYIDAARELGGNEIELDQLGIGVTRLNARLLGAAMDGPVKPPEAYDAAAESLRRDGLVVMGGVVPGQTTDAVAAALAEYVEADLLVYATSVPGVFDADPNESPDAERYDRLPAADLVELVAASGSLGSAGSNAPIDLLAAKLVQRSGIRTLVLDGADPERVRRAVRNGEFEGTEVVPDGVGEA